jgi:hypothetical protein
MTSAPLDWQLSYTGKISDENAAKLQSVGGVYYPESNTWIIPGDKVPESEIQVFARFPVVGIRKKHKHNKDPNAPKKALTGYFWFLSQNRADYVAKNPTQSATEVISNLAAMWRSMSDTEKAPYLQLAESDKVRYASEMDDYLQSFGDMSLE